MVCYQDYHNFILSETNGILMRTLLCPAVCLSFVTVICNCYNSFLGTQHIKIIISIFKRFGSLTQKVNWFLYVSIDKQFLYVITNKNAVATSVILSAYLYSFSDGYLMI